MKDMQDGSSSVPSGKNNQQLREELEKLKPLGSISEGMVQFILYCRSFIGIILFLLSNKVGTSNWRQGLYGLVGWFLGLNFSILFGAIGLVLSYVLLGWFGLASNYLFYLGLIIWSVIYVHKNRSSLTYDNFIVTLILVLCTLALCFLPQLIVKIIFSSQQLSAWLLDYKYLIKVGVFLICLAVLYCFSKFLINLVDNKKAQRWLSEKLHSSTVNRFLAFLIVICFGLAALYIWELWLSPKVVIELVVLLIWLFIVSLFYISEFYRYDLLIKKPILVVATALGACALLYLGAQQLIEPILTANNIILLLIVIIWLLGVFLAFRQIYGLNVTDPVMRPVAAAVWFLGLVLATMLLFKLWRAASTQLLVLWERPSYWITLIGALGFTWLFWMISKQLLGYRIKSKYEIELIALAGLICFFNLTIGKLFEIMGVSQEMVKTFWVFSKEVLIFGAIHFVVIGSWLAALWLSAWGLLVLWVSSNLLVAISCIGLWWYLLWTLLLKLTDALLAFNQGAVFELTTLSVGISAGYYIVNKIAKNIVNSARAERVRQNRALGLDGTEVYKIITTFCEINNLKNEEAGDRYRPIIYNLQKQINEAVNTASGPLWEMSKILELKLLDNKNNPVSAAILITEIINKLQTLLAAGTINLSEINYWLKTIGIDDSGIIKAINEYIDIGKIAKGEERSARDKNELDIKHADSGKVVPLYNNINVTVTSLMEKLVGWPRKITAAANDILRSNKTTNKK